MGSGVSKKEHEKLKSDFEKKWDSKKRELETLTSKNDEICQKLEDMNIRNDRLTEIVEAGKKKQKEELEALQEKSQMELLKKQEEFEKMLKEQKQQQGRVSVF